MVGYVAPNQAATLSPAALEVIGKECLSPIPNWLAKLFSKPSQIVRSRQIFLKRAQPTEEALISRHGLNVSKTIIADVPIVIIEPSYVSSINKHKIILNVHGGRVGMGSARDTSSLLAAAEWGIKVYSIDYTLAPEARYPIARDECLSVYRAVVRGAQRDAQDLICMGTATGGQILLSMLLKAQEERLALPKGVILSSPLADLSGSVGDSMIANLGRDTIDASYVMQAVRQNYQPTADRGGAETDQSPLVYGLKKTKSASPVQKFDTKDPSYSPVYASYNSSFPPTVISTGTRDLMLSTSIRLSWALKDAGVRNELLVSEGMWHSFLWNEELSEAIQARAAMRKFLESL